MDEETVRDECHIQGTFHLVITLRAGRWELFFPTRHVSMWRTSFYVTLLDPGREGSDYSANPTHRVLGARSA